MRIGAIRYLKLAFWIVVVVVGGVAIIRGVTGERLTNLWSPAKETLPRSEATECPKDTSKHPYCGELRHAEINDDRIVFDEENACSYRLVDLDRADAFTAMILRAKRTITFSKQVELVDCSSDVREGYLEREYEHLYYTADGEVILCGLAE